MSCLRGVGVDWRRFGTDCVCILATIRFILIWSCRCVVIRLIFWKGWMGRSELWRRKRYVGLDLAVGCCTEFCCDYQ